MSSTKYLLAVDEIKKLKEELQKEKKEHALTKNLNEKLNEQIYQLNVQLDSKDNIIENLRELISVKDQNLDATTDDMSYVKNQHFALKRQFNSLKKDIELVTFFLPKICSLQLKETPIFKITSSQGIEKRIVYPDLETFSELNLFESQPFKLALQDNSLMVKFGDLEMFGTGKAKNIQKSVTMNQAGPEMRIKTILFRLWNYKKGNIAAQRYSFEFLDKDDGAIAYIENLSEMEIKRGTKYQGYHFRDKYEEQCTLEENEIIVGVDMGVRESSNISNIKFLLAKI